MRSNRITWQDAYPDHPDVDRCRAWLTIETDDSLFDVPIEASDFPTRPADNELITPHKHNDGHWCSESICVADPNRRSWLCWPCEMAQWNRDDERAARGSGFGKK